MKFQTQQENYSDFTLTFKAFCAIENRMQAFKAKNAISKADRAKKSFSQKELLDKWAKMGNKVFYKDISFYWDGGFGILTVGNKSVAGATISDMDRAIQAKYGVKLPALQG